MRKTSPARKSIGKPKVPVCCSATRYDTSALIAIGTHTTIRSCARMHVIWPLLWQHHHWPQIALVVLQGR